MRHTAPRRPLTLIVTAALLAPLIGCKQAPTEPDEPPSPELDRGPAFWPMKQGGAARTGYRDVPERITTPTITWRAAVGAQLASHTPIVTDDAVYVGSSGDAIGAPDPQDGVYALSLKDGTQRWFTKAAQDVHGTSWSKGRVISAGADGAVWALDAANGRELWRWQAPSTQPIHGSPLVLDDHDLVVVGTDAGEVAFLDTDTGSQRALTTLEGKILGGAASDGSKIFVATTRGDIVAFGHDGAEAWRTRYTYQTPDDSADSPEAIREIPVRVISSPTVWNNDLIVTFTRESEAPTPAFVAFSTETGEVTWEPERVRVGKDFWWSIDASAAHGRERLMLGLPYTPVSMGYNLENRTALFVSTTRPCTQRHRPAPIIARDTVYLAREDGAIYATTATMGSGYWRAYLGIPERVLDYPNEIKDVAADVCHKTPPIGQPLLATPALARDGSIIIGSKAGELYKLSAPAGVEEPAGASDEASAQGE